MILKNNRTLSKIVVLFTLVAITCTAFLIRRSAYTLDDVTASPAEIHFGRIAEGTIITKNVRISNHTTRTLHIGHVYTSCGCTSARTDKEIAPGMSSRLLVTFDSHNKLGDINKSVLVKFTDYDTPLHISLTGQAYQEISVNPSQTDFGIGKWGDKLSHTVSLQRTDHKLLNIVRVETPDFIKAKVQYKPYGIVFLRLTLTVGSELAGEKASNIKIWTDDATLSSVDVGYRIKVPGEYKMMPDIVNLGAIGTKTIRKCVSIAGPHANKLSIVSLPSHTSAAVRAVSADRAVLTVIYKPKGEDHGSIVNSIIYLQTIDKRQPHIAIPLLGAVT